MKSNSWSNSLKAAPCVSVMYLSRPPVLKGCLARPEEDKSETYTGHSGDAKKK